jgi:hypothetical protein
MKPISRRALLRGTLAGTGVFVGLPLLEAMQPKAEDSGPDRFGVWFWGNGIRPDGWTPGNTGQGWSASTQLAPLSGLADYISPLTGFEIKTATHPHHSGMTGIMTGQAYYQLGTTRDTIVSTFARQSVDQDAADWFSGQTPFRSLELGITRFRGTDEGTTFQHLSPNGPNSPNPSLYDPQAVYERLFGVPSEAGLNLARQSVLDAVGEQLQKLESKVGTADRQRLEQHVESVRELELRLASDPSNCRTIDPPGSFPDVNGQEQIEPINAVMSELLALALACDLTRTFSVQFSTCGSGVIFWEVGAVDGMHTLCHFESLPQPTVQAGVSFTMQQLAVFLQTLKNTPEGSGNLLDRCSILCTTELSDGNSHTNSEFPILLAGKGNGRLKGGYHYRSSLRNTSDAVLTALHGAGIYLPSWGVDAGATSSVVSEVLT